MYFRCLIFLLGTALFSQTKPASDPDILIFANGERLIGRLVRSTGAKLVFKSESAGEVTIDWRKVQELRSSRQFAILEKDVNLGRHEETSRIPQGKLSMSAQTFTVAPVDGSPPATVPVSNSAHVVDETTFERNVVRGPGLLAGWRGAITAGATLVEATQQGRTVHTAINLSRPVPEEDWLDARNRTVFNFSGSYGILRQPDAPRVKTEVFHVDVEHDKYFTRRFFAFGQTAFDHNLSQGLDLQQNHGGGIGWTAYKTSASLLDIMASINYLNQKFEAPGVNQDLVGTTFSQTLNQKLRHGVVLFQQVSLTPSWNNLNAYAGSGNVTLTLPVYRHVNFTVGMVDTFLNNPSPGFRKNSFQLTTGLTFTME